MFNLTEYDVQKIKDRTIYLESGCWDWKGTKDKDGYSIVWIKGKTLNYIECPTFSNTAN